MKTNWTIFFENGEMKAFETIKEPKDPRPYTASVLYGDINRQWREFDKAVEAARLSALPVAQESQQKILDLLYEIDNPVTPPHNNTWLPIETKEYQIEAEFQEEVESRTFLGAPQGVLFKWHSSSGCKCAEKNHDDSEWWQDNKVKERDMFFIVRRTVTGS